MNAQEAVEVLKQNYLDELRRYGGQAAYNDQCEAALAALDGKHIYASRFKPGDRIWLVEEYLDDSGKHLVTEKPRTINHVDSRSRLWFEGSFPRFAYESDCFPTKAEAEAEAARRNQEGK